jgi:hypothetical protein
VATAGAVPALYGCAGGVEIGEGGGNMWRLRWPSPDLEDPTLDMNNGSSSSTLWRASRMLSGGLWKSGETLGQRVYHDGDGVCSLPEGIVEVYHYRPVHFSPSRSQVKTFGFGRATVTPSSLEA